MKTVLLKKLRKRYLWHYDPKTAGVQRFRVFDTQTKREISAFQSHLYYMSDMLLYTLIDDIGLIYLYNRRKEEKKERAKQKALNEKINYFKSKL